MKVYGYSNRKGGVGKTTLSTHAAYYCAATGKKTLLIDCDPQGNASKAFTGEKPALELVDVLTGRASPQEAVLSLRPGLDILATNGAAGRLQEYADGGITQEPMIFFELIGALRDAYDIAIMDLSPGQGTLERAALAACDEIIVPLVPEPLAADGVVYFRDALPRIRKGFRSNVKMSKVIINAINETMTVHRNYRDELLQLDGYDFFQVPQWAGFKTAQDNFQAIFEMDGGDKGRHAQAIDAIKAIGRAL